LVNLLIADNAIAETLISLPAIAGVTLTGSTRAGIAVATAAGRVLKKSVLELGGSDPFIVLADADIAATAEKAAMARCINSGQSCIAAKRFIIEAPIYDAFTSALVEAMEKRKVGNGRDRSTDVGPLARRDILENLHDQVRRSVAAGARLCCGGKRLGTIGFFYAPTVLADVKPGVPAFDEETFGPVAAVIRADSADDCVRLANQSSYGLGASIWTRDISAGESMAARLDAGNVFINGIVQSDPRLPFGGIKLSGWGRELSAIGIREFTNAKTVWIG
jgi:succinate-semialdehyde dehydrogenase/glutarate-semialdehyde dehydrogenase